jgi:hypothetical protein
MAAQLGSVLLGTAGSLSRFGTGLTDIIVICGHFWKLFE